MEPASPQGSRAKEGGGIKGRRGLFESEKPWVSAALPLVLRAEVPFLVAQKGTQPVESVDGKKSAFIFLSFGYMDFILQWLIQ